MPNTISHGNANQSHNEMLLHSHQDSYVKKRWATPSVRRGCGEITTFTHWCKMAQPLWKKFINFRDVKHRVAIHLAQQLYYIPKVIEDICSQKDLCTNKCSLQHYSRQSKSVNDPNVYQQNEMYPYNRIVISHL